MARTVCRRVLWLLCTLLLVTALAYTAFSILPGDPTASILGTEAEEEQIAALREKLGLDLPVWQRYLRWLGGFVTGDLGESYNYSMPVSQVLGARVGATLTLAALSMALIVAVSIPLGLLCANKPGGRVDRAVTVLGQLTMSTPNFVLGIGIIYLFALILHWFRPEYVPPSEGIGRHLWYMLFPALAVALPRGAMALKLLRGTILSQMGEDYVRTAYARGNSRALVLRRHVLRNAMIPVVTFLAMTVADVMAGSVVVEQVFGIPGLGQMLVTSIGNHDYPVVQAIVVIVAGAVVGCSFLADLLYRVMDPRVAYS